MSLTQLPSPAESDTSVRLDGDSLLIRDLTINHPEAAALAREHVAVHGDASLAGLVTAAIPVGLVALGLGSTSLNSAAVQRTLDLCASQVDAAASAAISKLDKTTAALHQGEQELVTSAQRVLERLPERVEAALAGSAGSVRAQVAAAAAEVQSLGLQEMRASMAQHSQAVHTALGEPIKTLSQEVLRQLASVRLELGGQLNAVQLLLTATQAAAATRPTRAIGLVFEDAAMKLAAEVVGGAGDFFQAVGSRPAPGSTSRAGDGIATLNTILTGRTGRPVKLVLEAKTRASGPLTAAKWLEELQASRDLRQASGALAIVPDGQVPGGRLFARVGERLFVCVCDEQILTLTYLVLRELTALAADRQGDVGAADISKAESRIGQALASLSDLDLVTRHSSTAQKSLAKIQEVSADVRTRVEVTLRESLAALHT